MYQLKIYKIPPNYPIHSYRFIINTFIHFFFLPLVLTFLFDIDPYPDNVMTCSVSEGPISARGLNQDSVERQLYFSLLTSQWYRGRELV